jgi:hypothetical protein
MVVLSASILSALGLRELSGYIQKNKLLTLGLCVILIFQTLPAPLPTTSPAVPEYVTVLADLPNDGGLVDLVKNRMGVHLYYQTIYKKPLAFGYLARIPTSVSQEDEGIANAIAAWDYAKLWGTYKIRYVLTSSVVPIRKDQPYMILQLLYHKKDIRIYRISCVCEAGP